MSARSKANSRDAQLRRRHLRVRRKVSGTAERPRLVVHRSLKNIQAHLADDVTGRVLLGVSTLAPELEAQRQGEEGSSKTELSRAAGKLLAERARAAGITSVVFDRGGYAYHGRVAAFAKGAREGGLDF
jgi:large subunit ribosomal protein L18